MCVYIKSDLLSLAVTSYTFKIQSAHTQINIFNSSDEVMTFFVGLQREGAVSVQV